MYLIIIFFKEFRCTLFDEVNIFCKYMFQLYMYIKEKINYYLYFAIYSS